MRNPKLKGSILITLGACCYGMLGTYVKMAYQSGFNTAEVTIAQFAIGCIGLFILTLVRRPHANTYLRGSIKSTVRLVLAGSSLGLTSIFYYMSVKYIAVSVAIVLLAQSVWMGVVVEAIDQKKLPHIGKMLAVLVIMAGTVLATNLLTQSISFNWKGIAFGLLGALCYTATMYSTNNLELGLPPVKRSLFMVLGGLIVVLMVFHTAVNEGFSGSIFFSWGLLIALFGTILPPLLFTRGMPLTGIGLGAVLAAIEIPIAVIMAGVLLSEKVLVSQWIGVALILGAVAWMNMPKRQVIKFKIKYDNKN
ncbi:MULTISPECIES: EamA family transporter [Niastella]|uniref:EamA family transporter n=1 Tax=Niastella soli TaxID=2821487 RepID=A0ABS3Z2C0_9BACT|nr:DMT family transporter [Niastella soli]MBO9204300.1 EamA family transporter [Niastella soli]